MTKFPEPPDVRTLAAIAPEVKRLERGTILWRLYFQGGRHPLPWNALRHYGPTLGRFDPHEPPPRVQRRAVLYAASTGPTSLAEVFQETRVIDRRAQSPWLVAFALTRPVALLDMTRTWPTRAGASMALTTGPRSRAQRWSRVIWAAYPAIEGIWYGSSMFANTPCAAFFERAKSAIPERPVFHRALTEPALLEPLRNAAYEMGYGLV